MIVELNSGQHELYRQKREYTTDLDNRVLWLSSFPFQRDMPETSKIYRYRHGLPPYPHLLRIDYQDIGQQLDYRFLENVGIEILYRQCVITLCFQSTQTELIYRTINDVVDYKLQTQPADATLLQNYPNPFNPSTQIEFDVPVSGHVDLTICNMLGEELVQLVDNDMQAGQYSVLFNGNELSSGTYIARLLTNRSTVSRKILLLR